MFSEKEQAARGKHNLSTVEGKVAYVKEMACALRGVPPEELTRGMHIVARAAGLPFDTILREVVADKPPDEIIKITWGEMVEIEPELNVLLIEAEGANGSGKNFCANSVFFELFKPGIRRLVGYYSRDERLMSSECYDIAYQKIYSALPPCRECLCL